MQNKQAIFAPILFISTCFGLASISDGTLQSSTNTFSVLLLANTLGTAFKAKALNSRRVQTSLLLPSFVHLDLPHFAFNMVPLFAVWDSASKRYGVEYTFAGYLSGSILTTAASKLRNPTQITFGASGAVSALLGSVLWKEDFGPILHPTGGISFIIVHIACLTTKRLRDSIDLLQHLFGFGIGSAISFLTQEKMSETNRNG